MKSPYTSASLVVEGLTKTYGPVVALNDVSLNVQAGEVFTLLGPSGSGKTTLLKSVAGFEPVDRGRIVLAGVDITYAPPAKRDIGMVFQNYALFPHLTVAQNIAFPLEMRRYPRRAIQEEVAEALKLVELEGYADRLPKQLSGGQQQRVALARAIVFKPRLLLLDEPFGALDRKLRESMQLELRRLQKRLGITTLFVTHDQEEALILSDRIAVMNRGAVEQIGLPDEIYRLPRNWFVADFIGESNLLPAEILVKCGCNYQAKLPTGEIIYAQADPNFVPQGPVALIVRPERVQIGVSLGKLDNRFIGTVSEIVYLGQSCKLRISLPSGLEILARLADTAASRASVGDTISFGWMASDARLIAR